MIFIKRIKPEFFILIAIILFFIITNLIWLSNDTLPPSWDDSIHMKSCLLYARQIPQIRSIADLNSISASGIDMRYPPLFYISTLPIVYVFGFIEDYLIFMNFFYLILLVLSIYAIGRIMFDSRVGMLSAFLVLLYPLVFALSRRYLLDFALLSVVAVVQYLILKFKIEEKKKLGFLLIMVATAAVLVKQSSAIFFVPTMILLFFLGGWRKKKFSLVFIFGALISLVLVFIYYRELIIFWFGDISRLSAYFLPKFLWYMDVIRHAMLSTNLFLFFLIGLASFLFFDRRWKVLLILGSWIIPAFFVMSLIRGRGIDARYLVAFLPAFALITVGGINALPKRYIRNILLSGLVGIGLIQFFNISFNLPPFLVKEKDFFYNRSPLRQNWQIKEILRYTSWRFKDRELRIGIFPNCEFFNADEFILYATLMRLPYSIEGLLQTGKDRFVDKLKDCDVVITKSPFSSIYCPDDRKAKFYEDLIEKKIREYNFRRIMQFDLPDNSRAMVYQNEK